MKISAMGLDALKQSEGLRTKSYHDSAGKLTIGVGHLLTGPERESSEIIIKGRFYNWRHGLTEAQCLELLDEDVEWAENAVNLMVTVPLTQGQFDCLVNFVFNVGARAFQKSTLLKLLNMGQLEDVPAQLRRWVNAGGRRVAGLVNRREREINLWESTWEVELWQS